MSLILEALKKSEQERRRDKGPDLQTIHQPIASAALKRSYSILWIGLVVVLNVAALGYWVWHFQHTQSAVANTAPAPAQAAPVAVAPTGAAVAAVAAPTLPAPAPAQPAPTDSSPEYTRYEPNQGFAPRPAPAPATMPAPASTARVQELAELSPSQRNAVPAMTFSFHVYSADPQRRTIIINNRRLREGDSIDTGVDLQEITEDGVIITMDGRRIHIGVLAGW